MRRFSVCVVGFVILGGCGGGEESVPPDAAGPADAAGRDALVENWTLLIGEEWTLEGGTENFARARRTLTEDVYARAIRPLAPAGTHHTLLGVATPEGGGPGTSPDGLIYGSGV